MALLGKRRVRKSSSRQSHGLPDVYEVPSSPLRSSSAPKQSHPPRPSQPGKTYGQKRLKPSLRVSRKSASSTLRYERTTNNVGELYDNNPGELPQNRPNIMLDDEDIQSALDGRRFEAGSQLDGMPEVARTRLMEMALEGLFATGESSVTNDAGDASFLRGNKKAVTRQATIPVENLTAKILGRDGSNTVDISPHILTEDGRLHPMQNQAVYVSTFGDMRSSEKDMPPPTLFAKAAVSKSLLAPQSEVVGTSVLNKASDPLGGRLSEGYSQNVDVTARPNVPYPASLLGTAVEIENQNIADEQTLQLCAEAFNVDICKSGNAASNRLDMHAIDTSIPDGDTTPKKRRIEAIEDLRMNEDGHTDFLIKWEGIDYEFATWEHEESILSSAPRLLYQYLKGMVFAESRIEQAERERELQQNQASTDRFLDSDVNVLEIDDPVENNDSTKDEQAIGHNSTIEDSQSFGDDEFTVDDQSLMLESVLQHNALEASQSLPKKRGRGRPRKSEKSTLPTRVSRRTTTLTVDHFEMSGVSLKDGLRQTSDFSTESQSRLSQNDFSMPSAAEVLEAARKLPAFRNKRQNFVAESRRHQQQLVKCQRNGLAISSDDPIENPYKKYYLTGQSNRRLKSQQGIRSRLRGSSRRDHQQPPTSKPTETRRATVKVVPRNIVAGKRRGRPPGSRNKVGRPAQLQPRSSIPVLKPTGIRKRRPGRAGLNRRRNGLFSSLRSTLVSRSEPDRVRTRTRASRSTATFIELDSIFDHISNLSRM